VSYMALQTVPPHVYDTQDEPEEVSFIDTHEFDYTPSPSRPRRSTPTSASTARSHSSGQQHQQRSTQRGDRHDRSIPQPLTSTSINMHYINNSSVSTNSLPSTVAIVSEPDQTHTEEEGDDEEPLFTGRRVQRRIAQPRDTQSSPEDLILVSSSSTSRGSIQKSQRLATLDQLREQRSHRQSRHDREGSSPIDESTNSYNH
jgi:hypothetical protein